jgi:cytochrome P450
MHSPEFFDDPMSFKPERYLKDGACNPRALLDPDQVAFGFGRRHDSMLRMHGQFLIPSLRLRICPGRHFSNEALVIFLASILACFSIKPPKDEHGEELPMKPMNIASLIVS